MRPCTYLDPRGRERCTECGVTIDLCLCVNPSDKANFRHVSAIGQFTRAVYEEASANTVGRNLFEHLVEQVGQIGAALVSNLDTNSPNDNEIRQLMVKAGRTLTLLAAEGTPEYPYPSA